MNDQEHCDQVLDKFADLVTRKYDKGQKEHGGELWKKRVRGHAMDEILDLAIYMVTLEYQMRDAIWLIADGLKRDDKISIYEGLNILTSGNKDGKFLEPSSFTETEWDR